MTGPQLLPYMIPKFELDQMAKIDMDLCHSAMRRAIENVQAKLQSAARKAFLEGKDFAIGPISYGVPDPFGISNIFEPIRYSIDIPAGAVDRDWPAPMGWKVVKRPDFTEGELERLRDQRLDWREFEWEDHCGIPDCPQCDKDPTVL